MESETEVRLTTEDLDHWTGKTLVSGNIQGRILVKIAALNSAHVMCDRVVVSPEAMHDLQYEMSVGSVLWNEAMNWRFGELPRQTVFGLPLVVDPDLTGNQVSLEIDA
jgi:hypothetical protein